MKNNEPGFYPDWVFDFDPFDERAEERMASEQAKQLREAIKKALESDDASA